MAAYQHQPVRKWRNGWHRRGAGAYRNIEMNNNNGIS
jgi:hypothetical protein